MVKAPFIIQTSARNKTRRHQENIPDADIYHAGYHFLQLVTSGFFKTKVHKIFYLFVNCKSKQPKS